MLCTASSERVAESGAQRCRNHDHHHHESDHPPPETSETPSADTSNDNQRYHRGAAKLGRSHLLRRPPECAPHTAVARRVAKSGAQRWWDTPYDARYDDYILI